jgi:D-alanine transaminase
MRELACLNGELQPIGEAKISVWDRGFLFGDAVYEVMRVYRGRCWLEREHMARLGRSLGAVEIEGVDLGRLRERVQGTLAASGIQEGTVYVQVTRGVAARSHPYPRPRVEPTELIAVRVYDDGPMARRREEGGRLHAYPDLRWRRCDIKTTNLLANVFAAESACASGADEAVLYLPDGRVTEASHSSLLWVRRGGLEGTPEGSEILPGTTRAHFLELARAEGIPFCESEITLGDLRTADEVILTGTTLEVLPIVNLDGQAIADGRPGPIARRLQRAFRRSLERWLNGGEGGSEGQRGEELGSPVLWGTDPAR